MSLRAHVQAAVDADRGRLLKTEADYEPVGHADTHCGPTRRWPATGECAHFQPPAGCERVAGHISPRAWCRLWAAKDGTE